MSALKKYRTLNGIASRILLISLIMSVIGYLAGGDVDIALSILAMAGACASVGMKLVLVAIRT